MAFNDYEEGLAFAKSVNNKNWIAQALRVQGISFYNRGNYEEALIYYKKSLKIYEEIGKKYGISNCLNCIGLNYKANGNLAKAIEYYTESLKLKVRG